MKRLTKISLWVAAGLIIFGLILAAAVFALNIDDPLATFSRTKDTAYEIDGTFEDISVTLGAMNVEFALSGTGENYVVFRDFDNGKIEHTAKITDGVLTIERTDGRAWYEYINVTIGEIKVTLFLTEKEYNTLSVKMSSGNLKIPDSFNFRNADIRLSSGNVKYDARIADSLSIETKSGNIKLDHVFAKEINCKASSGNISLSGVDGENLKFETSSGNIRGSVASEKVFVTETGSGNVHVPKTSSGGTCEIRTGSGNINITVD